MKFSEFAKESTPDAPSVPQPTFSIGGCFNCQTCDEVCDEADFFQAEKILRWKCSQNHISFIEGFNL